MKNNQILAILIALVIGIGAGFLYGQAYERMMHDQEHEHNHHYHEYQNDHNHQSIEISSDLPVPELAINVEKDPVKGYNLFINVQNFRFAPENASRQHVDGEGHAHLLINGEKITRLYAPAYFLGDDFPSGEHEVVVELSSNDHSLLTKDGEPIFAIARFFVE